MNISTDHTIDRTIYPPRPAIIHLTLDGTAYSLTPTEARDVVEALTNELDAVKSWQITVHIANNPSDAARLSHNEQVENDRQRLRQAIAEREAADEAERTRQAQEAAARRKADYDAQKAAADARWEARAERIKAMAQEAAQ